MTSPLCQSIFHAQSAFEGLYNTRLKFYTINGNEVLAEVMTFQEPIFNPDGLEARSRFGRRGKCEANAPESEERDERATSVARNRARRKVFDYVCGDEGLDLFCTLTLDREKISRDDWEEIIRKLNIWLDNRVRRHKLKYVLVPEFHKDGKSIHFHGCMNSEALKLAASGKKDKGKEVLNIVSWKYGFTTAKRIDANAESRVACAKYIAKYMTKDNEKIGGRYYLHGGALTEPRYLYVLSDFDAAAGHQISVGTTFVKIDSRI